MEGSWAVQPSPSEIKDPLSNSCHVVTQPRSNGEVISRLTELGEVYPVVSSPVRTTMSIPATTITEPLSVSVPEATRLLGFKDTKTTYKLIHEGKVRARKVGRIFLVSYSSLKSFIED